MNIDTKAINTLRVISAEGITKANSGHPGICLGAAPIIYTLFDKALKFNSSNPSFVDRDRFVLSAGHGSMMLYTTLHMFGYNVTKEDLMNFRQFGSKTPGHPEYGMTEGVEVSTGPLGQGIANAVGMAIAERHLAETFNKDGYNIVDHYTYALCGDGCNMEGIGYEAVSLAGSLKLGKLIVLYDRNKITIEGSTDIAFTEDVGARYSACGWQVIDVADANDTVAIENAIKEAKREENKPSLIVCHSTIGYGAPAQGTAKVHGSPLSIDAIAELRKTLGYTEEPFAIASDVQAHLTESVESHAKCEENWNKLFAEYSSKYPNEAKEFIAWQKGEFGGIEEELNKLTFDKPEATRNVGFKCINAVANVVPSLFGGSADLTPSNKTNMTNRADFSADNYAGSNVHFGIREHAMSAICNGIAVHGGVKPYCSTFFVFSDYMKGAMRVSALMNAPVNYILTHDSIGVGEDGPTHEPIEQLASLRSTPNINVYRPADGNECKTAYKQAFTNGKTNVIVLSRQNLPQLGNDNCDIEKGGYILSNCQGTPDVILMGSGSEVQYCIGAKALLEEKGIKTRVVSMPCMEEYERQSESYKESVLPKCVRARVAVEAGSSMCWDKYVGLDGTTISMDTFGASAPFEELYKHFGFTTENVAEQALKIVNKWL